MGRFGIGQGVPRCEDERLVTGRGRFTDDLTLPGQTYAAVVRATEAHARLAGVETAAARAAPGVLAVITAADLAAAGIGTPGTLAPFRQRDGRPPNLVPRSLLAANRVRHVGEAVALVVAETAEAARDAAELVEVVLDPLPAVVCPVAALAPGAPAIWDQAPGNLCFDWELGDAAATAAGFAAAARVVELSFVNNRVIAHPLEGRACNAVVEPATGRLTLHVASQGVHGLKRQLARDIFKRPADQIRVVTGDVGGGFGMKMFLYPEYVLTLFAARQLGRPVKWTAERSEGFLADTHGRDHVTTAALALDADGRFLAMRVEVVANLGATLSELGAYIPTLAGAKLHAGVYRTPAIHLRVRGAFTNTAPVDAYRGAGRPEAAYCIERLVDIAARQLGLDPAELRRRNFIPADAMPYTTALGATYDSGDFARVLDLALARADAAGFADRRAAAARRGRARGLGFASYIEVCGAAGAETATLEVAADGRVTVLIGTQSNGQGHETAYAQVIADRLGLDPSRVTVVQGDSDRIATGGGTGASRSIPVGAAAIAEGAELLKARMIAAAADQLEAAATDLAFDPDRGCFTVVGTDRSLRWTEVAAAAAPADGGPSFREQARYSPPASTYPNGCHVCELEVDPDTGAVEILRYTVVDDFGTVVNPELLAGQVHGGVAQGIGQALLERTVYDPDTGQLLTGAFVDYALPRADTVPAIDFSTENTPCRTNALGIKGAGEAGAIGAPPAVINALVDALAPLGVTHIDMPATPHAVWQAIRAARGDR